MATTGCLTKRNALGGSTNTHKKGYQERTTQDGPQTKKSEDLKPTDALNTTQRVQSNAPAQEALTKTHPLSIPASVGLQVPLAKESPSDSGHHTRLNPKQVNNSSRADPFSLFSAFQLDGG